ncbi:MAG: hypothetical protein ACR2OE_06675 [Thermomicrobiales bacterium]
MTRRFARWMVIGLFVLGLAFQASPAAASGSAGISGSATQGAITWFYYSRYISNPASPGPEVAFNMSGGPSGLALGIHDCNQGGAGPFYYQYPGTWQPVGFSSGPRSFCLFSYSNSGSGTFSGTLAWD